MTPLEFIALIGPAAQVCAKKSGVPASVTVAQAALESGWGESGLARKGRNLFGVKADASWKGDILTMQTKEFLNGSWVVVTARWRKYSNWQRALDDHAAFLKNNKRYAECFQCQSGVDFAQAVAKAGYATDPRYAYKLISIIEKHNLAQLDGEVA